jgi:hypothetical protein
MFIACDWDQAGPPRAFSRARAKVFLWDPSPRHQHQRVKQHYFILFYSILAPPSQGPGANSSSCPLPSLGGPGIKKTEFVHETWEYNHLTITCAFHAKTGKHGKEADWRKYYKAYSILHKG